MTNYLSKCDNTIIYNIKSFLSIHDSTKLLIVSKLYKTICLKILEINILRIDDESNYKLLISILKTYNKIKINKLYINYIDNDYIDNLYTISNLQINYLYYLTITTYDVTFIPINVMNIEIEKYIICTDTNDNVINNMFDIIKKKNIKINILQLDSDILKKKVNDIPYYCKIILTDNNQEFPEYINNYKNIIIFGLYINHIMYKGIWKNNKLINGTVTYSENYFEEGEFENNILVKGKRTTIDDQYYNYDDYDDNVYIYIQEGEWQNSIFIKGKIIYSNGNIEEGDFENDKLVQGKIIYANSHLDEEDHFKNSYIDLEEGHFKNGKIVNGRIIFSNGTIAEGDWINATLAKGKIILSSGEIQIGEWINNSFKGQYIFPNITRSDDDENDESDDSKYNFEDTYVHTKEGYFEYNELVKGKITFIDGKIQEGVWDDNLFKGKLIYPDGSISKGEWKKGNLNKVK